jgi:hypothetical protein
MKNLKIVKEYYTSLSNTGKICFVIVLIGLAYTILEVIS